MWVHLDVETSPPLNTFPNKLEVRVPKNYKDQRKIDEYREEKAYEQWASQALHPAKAQVVIVGACVDDGEIFQAVNADEHALMVAFDAWLEEHAPVPDNPKEPAPILNAYNGLGFDFRMLAMRAVKYDLPRLARRMRLTNKWGDAQHRDPFEAVGREGKLFEWAKFFGIPVETDHDGSEVHELIRAGQSALALKKNFEDVRILRELTNKLVACGVM